MAAMYPTYCTGTGGRRRHSTACIVVEVRHRAESESTSRRLPVDGILGMKVMGQYGDRTAHTEKRRTALSPLPRIRPLVVPKRSLRLTVLPRRRPIMGHSPR